MTEYWTRDPDEWQEVIDWQRLLLGNLYSRCMNHKDMPHYAFAPHGKYSGTEISAKEYIRIAEDRIEQIKREVIERPRTSTEGQATDYLSDIEELRRRIIKENAS